MGIERWKSKALLLPLLAFLAFSSGCVTLSAPISTSAGYACGMAGYGSWVAIGAIGLISSVFLLVLVYMASVAIQNKGGEVWAKNEFYQVGANAFIIVNLAFLVGIMCSTDFPALFGLPGGNLFDLAFSYLNWLNATIIESYIHVMIIQFRVSVATSFTMAASAGGIGANLQPMLGLSSIESALNLALQAITVAWITNLVQIEVLKYVMVAMFNIVLPAGVVLRSFSFTRNFGGALMGLAIGLFIFYPVLLGLNSLAIKDATDKVVSDIESNYKCTIGSTDECCSRIKPCVPAGSVGLLDPSGTRGVCQPCLFIGEADNAAECCSNELTCPEALVAGACPTKQVCKELKYKGDMCASGTECFSGKCEAGFCTSCKLDWRVSSVEKDEITRIFKTIARLAATGALAFLGPLVLAAPLFGGAVGLIIGGMDVFFGVMQLISNLLIAAILLPALNFVVLVTITRDLSRFLGEEVDVSNLTRMI